MKRNVSKIRMYPRIRFKKTDVSKRRSTNSYQKEKLFEKTNVQKKKTCHESHQPQATPYLHHDHQMTGGHPALGSDLLLWCCAHRVIDFGEIDHLRFFPGSIVSPHDTALGLSSSPLPLFTCFEVVGVFVHVFFFTDPYCIHVFWIFLKLHKHV